MGSNKHKEFNYGRGMFMVAASLISLYVSTLDHAFAGYMSPEFMLLPWLAGELYWLALRVRSEGKRRELALESHERLTNVLGATALLAIVWTLVSPESIVSYFNGYALSTPYVDLFKIFILVTSWIILKTSRFYIEAHSRAQVEFSYIYALAVFFMLVLVGANHLMTVFLSLSGFSLALYVLILSDAPAQIAREAGVKYYYLSTFSTGLIVYGIYLIYSVAGTGNFDALAFVLQTNPALMNSTLFRTGVLLLVIGFLFKLSAFPGHLWAPEVYEGSPLPITALFMLPSKVAVLTVFLRMLAVPLHAAGNLWLPIVAIASLGSLLWGCFAALQERNIRRFLAYTSINQMGYLLLGVSCGTYYGYSMTILYLCLYVLMSTIFLIVFLSSRRTDGYAFLYLTDFQLFQKTDYLPLFAFHLTLFSMAGIPPLAGFFGKYYLLLHALEKGLLLLVVTALFTSLISTYYYLRLVKLSLFDAAPEKFIALYDARTQQFALPLLFLFALPLVFFSAFSESALTAARALADSLLSTPYDLPFPACYHGALVPPLQACSQIDVSEQT